MPRSRSSSLRKAEAQRLRRLRELLGTSQRELALEFNVAHGAIAGWESGKRTIPGPVLKLIELYEEELGLDPEDAGLRRLKTSRLQRNLAYSRLGASLSARVGAQLFEGMLGEPEQQGAIAARAQGAIARRLVATLGELKGVAMKLGQALACADFALPEALRAELRCLLVSSSPLAPSVVARLFLQELGRSPREMFREWSAAPFAAASIGQVHRARLHDGREVAVKVQYPAIVQAVEADLENAALIDRLATLLFRGQERGAWFEELSERFREECDYRIEAQHQQRFAELWAGHPGIRIPRVVPELCAQRVLVTEFASGQSFDAFVSSASVKARQLAGMQLWQFSLESIFRHGVFNADPHPGNYLFQREHVVALDFGCVKRFPLVQLALWKSLMRAVLERDRARASRCLQEAGMAAPGFDFDHHLRVLLTLYRPFLSDEPFEFNLEFVTRTWAAFTSRNPNRFRMNVPRDWVLVNRLHWGLGSLLAALRVRAAFRGPMLDLLYAPGEARPTSYSAAELAAVALSF